MTHSSALPLSGACPQPRRPAAFKRMAVMSALWLAAVLGGTAMLTRYAEIPGPPVRAPLEWPSDSQIHPDGVHPTLVMFLHPQCPCSRASLGELEQVMIYCHGRLKVQVVFLQPEGTGEDWVKTDLWRKAESIPGVTASADAAGEECLRFHAMTSGQALLYSKEGHLEFQGGITSSRGHAGDNTGRSEIVALTLGKTTHAEKTPVFGCELFDSNCEKGGLLARDR